MQEFAEFMYTVAKSELENFSVEKMIALTLSFTAVHYPTTWSVVEMASLLSHGQAPVE